MIRPEDVKRLRDQTGAGIMDAKRALEAAGGDMVKATAHLREQGLASAAKKAGRQAREGLVASYIHTGGRLGALVEINCETDFVARTDDFAQLAREMAMQVAGMAPLYVSREQIPADALEEQRRIFADDTRRGGRPEDKVPMIVEGKLNKWFEQVCLVDQPYRDTDRTAGDLVKEKIALLGENIRVARFTRFVLGESSIGDAAEGA
ncbi:MAG: translation elongation factor Ts [Chloroflexota bacterium]